MREIITLQVGGCGNAIGSAFWNLIATEHSLEPSCGFSGNATVQLDKINVFFNETSGFYKARAVCIDLDATSIKNMKNSRMGLLFQKCNLVYGTGAGTGNNFASGYYTQGRDLLEASLESIRREAEFAESLQGFQLLHSMGGGTGSGLGSLLMEYLIEDYSEKLIQTYSIIPSGKFSDVLLEPYNTLLGIKDLLYNCHFSFILDNDQMCDICVKSLGMQSPEAVDVNHIVAQAMSGVTTTLRFPGQLNSSLMKLYVNSVPFPNLHFLIPGSAPLTNARRAPYLKMTASELANQIFNSKTLLTGVDLRTGRMLSIAAIFRGKMSTKKVDLTVNSIKEKYKENFVDFIPNNIKTAICEVPQKGIPLSSTVIVNTTSIVNIFTRMLKAYRALYQKKAFLNLYLEEGIERQDFAFGEEYLQKLSKEYKDQEKNLSPNELAKLDKKGSECCLQFLVPNRVHSSTFRLHT